MSASIADSPGQAPDLPVLHEGMLDQATLEQLFSDIAANTQLLEIATKGAPTRRAEECAVNLTQALEMLSSRSVRAVQLRYRYQGAEWWDTLTNTKEGVRLVRIHHTWTET